MKTLLLSGARPEDIARAGEILQNGGLVGIPTETVYGLAANALDPAAVGKIFAAKGRPADNPLIVHIAELSQWEPLVAALPPRALALAEAFWPGPLTVILPKAACIPDLTSGGLSTVAVRFPAHPVAQAVIRAAGVPLAAPSANRSGRPSPTTFAHLREDMDGRADALLDGGDCGVGVESTVLSLAGEHPRLLRPGKITVNQLRAILPDLEVDPAVLHQLGEGAKAASPGMKYKHYAPRAELTLVDAAPRDFVDYVNLQRPDAALCFTEDLPGLTVPALSLGSRYDPQAQAHALFTALHQLDVDGAATVLGHLPSRRGVGLAVVNRILRAAAFRVVEPVGHRLLGLTGPSGAGKSLVSQLLEASGVPVIDCDALSRDSSVYGPETIAALQAAFGEDVAPGGVLDRRLTARRALATPAGKERLQAITFPPILAAVRARAEALFAGGSRLAAVDAPTLFEAGLDDACARILTVTAPEATRLARIMSRDGLSEDAARQRLAAQHTEEFYVNHSDYLLENGPGVTEARLAAALAPILQELEVSSS